MAILQTVADLLELPYENFGKYQEAHA